METSNKPDTTCLCSIWVMEGLIAYLDTVTSSDGERGRRWEMERWGGREREGKREGEKEQMVLSKKKKKRNILHDPTYKMLGYSGIGKI